MIAHFLCGTLRIAGELPKESAILMGTFDELTKVVPELGKMPELHAEGFWLRTVDLAFDQRMDLPMTQQQVGEALGFSPVHTNRTIQTLREKRLLTWRDQEVEILDWPGLAALAEFDPTYLRLSKEPA